MKEKLTAFIVSSLGANVHYAHGGRRAFNEVDDERPHALIRAIRSPRLEFVRVFEVEEVSRDAESPGRHFRHVGDVADRNGGVSFVAVSRTEDRPVEDALHRRR